MNLPAMCPAFGQHHHYITPPSLRVCWRTTCFQKVDPDDGLGLCDGCVAELRAATNL